MKYSLAVIAASIVLACFYAFSNDHKNQVVFTDKAPAPIGPYSQAIRSGGSLYVSGQLALRSDGTLDSSTVENECRVALENVKAIVEAGGKTMGDVVKATVYCTNLKHFGRMNEVYKTYFSANPPARETVEVKALPKGAHIEISVVAH